jgi:hypothetical protein
MTYTVCNLYNCHNFLTKKNPTVVKIIEYKKIIRLEQENQDKTTELGSISANLREDDQQATHQTENL